MSTATTPLAYPTTALDRGLRLIQIVRDTGGVRVMDAADELGVSRSSAHRLLQELVYRDFLVQNEDRVYEAGPALSASAVTLPWARTLSRLAQPHMDALVLRLGFASNLMIRIDWQVRFLRCVTFVGGTYDRTGSVMLAHRTAGGRALLAHLDDEALASLYPLRPTRHDAGQHEVGHRGKHTERGRTGAQPLTARELGDLKSKVSRVREWGFAVARAEVDSTVSALGTCVCDPQGAPLAALTVSARAPGVITNDKLRSCVDGVFAARHAIESDLSSAWRQGPPHDV